MTFKRSVNIVGFSYSAFRIFIYESTIIIHLLAPVNGHRSHSLVFPLISPHIPSPLLPWPTLSPPTTQLPPIDFYRATLLCRPSRVWTSSDLKRHHHLPKAAVLPEKAELSQSPCGGQPSVPLFLWFSHHWAKPHGSSTPVPASPTVVPLKLPKHQLCSVLLMSLSFFCLQIMK